jgi:hypothetical protein
MTYQMKTRKERIYMQRKARIQLNAIYAVIGLAVATLVGMLVIT